MEREDLLLAYGINGNSEKLCFDSISCKYGEENINALSQHMAERLRGKKFVLFISFDMDTADEKQMPFADFIFRKYGIRSEFVAEPILGTKHYMNRRGAVMVEEAEFKNVIQALSDFPYHMFGAIVKGELDLKWVNDVLNLWNGRALMSHVLNFCVPAVLNAGAEFLHLLKNSGEVTLNCLYMS